MQKVTLQKKFNTMKESLWNKLNVRSFLKKQRSLISLQRREDAHKELNSTLPNLIADFPLILSFSSFSSEISLSLFNETLARQGRLALPRIHNSILTFHHVTNPQKELIPNSWGIFEPDPSHCPVVKKTEMEIILVPALGFDHRGHRLGYGKGYYDRFLATHPFLRSYGVGFLEQYFEKLPTESHDISLSQIVLF